MERLHLRVVPVSYDAHSGQSFEVRCTDVPDTATSIEVELFKGRNRVYSNTLTHNGGNLKHLLPALFGDHKLYVAAKSGSQTIAEGQHNLDGPWHPSAKRDLKIAIAVAVATILPLFFWLGHAATRVIAVYTSEEMDFFTLPAWTLPAAGLLAGAGLVGLIIVFMIILRDQVGDLKEWVANKLAWLQGHRRPATSATTAPTTATTVPPILTDVVGHLSGEIIKNFLHRLPVVGRLFKWLLP